MTNRRRRRQKSEHGVALQRSDSPRKSALAEIKVEVVRLGNNGTRKGFKFAERFMQALPELREA